MYKRSFAAWAAHSGAAPRFGRAGLTQRKGAVAVWRTMAAAGGAGRADVMCTGNPKANLNFKVQDPEL